MKNNHILIQYLCIVMFLFSIPAFTQPLNFLFKNGEEGYKCFRIPAIIKTKTGNLLAFAEGRKNNCDDAGDIDIVVKRSVDNGKTWSKLSVVWDDSTNTCGNPAPVVDSKTGNIILLSTWNLGDDHEWQIINGTSKNTRSVYSITSTDGGKTWSKAKEITSSVKKQDWTWYATGPCNGIEIQKGKNKGRIIIPCDHIEALNKKYYSHIIYTDDGGLNWKIGGSTPVDKVNECSIAELEGEKLMLTMRNYGQARYRQTSISSDGGEIWSEPKSDSTLIEPVCQASLLRYEYKKAKPFLVFSNPANQTSRIKMTVRLSYDQGKSWKQKNVIYEGPSAYSNLVVLANGNLACFYKAGVNNPYEGIVFQELFFKDFK